MKIILVTAGSRGDVQPYVALGQGLQRGGHAVTLLTDPAFADMARTAGLDFAGVEIITEELMQSELHRMGGSPWKLARWIERHYKPLSRRFFRDIYDACQGMDAVLYSTLAFAGFHVAQALRLPALAAYTTPITPTREFHNPSAAAPPEWLPLRGEYNYLSMLFSNMAFMRLIYATVNESRVEVGLPPARWRAYASLPRTPLPAIYGYSPLILPKPVDWGDWLHVCGYWFLDTPADWQPPAALLAFLDAGPAPVYVGFGSMVDQEAPAITSMVIDALKRARQRGILLGGWAGLGQGALPETVIQVDAVPHSWLFPRVSAVVHHGGAGTTAAGLRAGKPTVVVPYFADQPFWGWRVEQLGVGPPLLMRRRLTAESLAQAIRQAVSDDPMRQRAARLGEKLRAEDGVGNAVAVIEDYLARWPSWAYDPFSQPEIAIAPR